MTSVPLTAQHMSEIPEPRANPNAQFLAGDLPHLEGEKSRLSGSLAVSVGTHVAGFLLFLFVIANMPDPAPNVAPRDVMPTESIWMDSPSPGGGDSKKLALSSDARSSATTRHFNSSS